ncbi:MAG: hypothetical protein ABEH43_10055 [Flavobacteriales bacterium]
MISVTHCTDNETIKPTDQSNSSGNDTTSNNDSTTNDTSTTDTTQQTACDTLLTNYSSDIDPIFENNCATSGCHTQASLAGGFALKTHSEQTDAVNNQPVLCSIKHNTGCSPMPQVESKMADTLIKKIECWVDDGMPDN